jgi:hypothetical protein
LSGANNSDDLNAAIKLAEKKPDDKSRQETLKEELKSAGATDDHDVLQAAQALLQLIQQQAPVIATQYNVNLTGSGAAAVGPEARAGQSLFPCLMKHGSIEARMDSHSCHFPAPIASKGGSNKTRLHGQGY